MCNLLDDFAELAGQRGEIKEQVVAAAARCRSESSMFFELSVGRGVGDVALAIKNIVGELVPDLVIHRFGAGKLVERRAQFLAPRVVGFFPARKADDAESRAASACP